MRLDPLAFLDAEIENLRQQGLHRSLRVLQGRQQATSDFDGRTVVNLSSNNYLGLTTHPRLIESALAATREFGAGSGSVRTIAGTMAIHMELERRLAIFKKVEAVVVFQSGFAANAGTVSAILTKDDVIISDELNHASIIDGCRLSKAAIKVFPHKDADAARKILKDLPAAQRKLLITDGVFSMDGDIGALPALCDLAEEFGCIMMVDDAHASGVFGKNGRGTIDHFNLHGRVDIQVGTLSKAMGALGGYVAGSAALIDFLHHRARPFLFSTSHPPAVAAACLAALDVLEQEPEIIDRLWDNTKFFKQGLVSMGFNTGLSESPITPVIAGEGSRAMKLSDRLFEEGVFASGIAFPTVARDKARVRTIVTAAHTKDELQFALDKFKLVGTELGLIYKRVVSHMVRRRAKSFLDDYTRDLTPADVQRLFTRDTAEAYRYFTRHADPRTVDALPWYRRWPMRLRLVYTGFTKRLSPPRRALYGAGVLSALIGSLILFRGFAPVRLFLFPFSISVPLPDWVDGTAWLIVGFIAVNLLILMEVADRLSLKGDLEIARDIQLAMLPSGERRAGDATIAGITRPANTVGGDFYDVIDLPDGRVVVALGDVAGKGSPAALLMALLLAMLRTLVDEGLESARLIARLNLQVARQSPASRFITFFYGLYDPGTGVMQYVNAGHLPPLLFRASGSVERIGGGSGGNGGLALGMFEHATYTSYDVTIGPGDTLVMYTDGITEAENAAGNAFEDTGLIEIVTKNLTQDPSRIGAAVLAAVDHYAGDVRLADDLTALVLTRAKPAASPEG